MKNDDDGARPDDMRAGDRGAVRTVREGVLRRGVRGLFSGQTRYRLRGRLMDTPVVSELFILLSPTLRRFSRLTRRTDLLIDGFPRSANSYSASIVSLTNPDTVLISHLHSHHCVQRAVRLGVPVVVLIREPRTTIASAVQFLGVVEPIHIIRAYLRYYSRVERLLGSVVLTDFSIATVDFNAVMRACNERFGTELVPYVPTEELEAAARTMIDAWTEATVSAEHVMERYPRPTVQRTSAEEICAAFDDETRAELARAEELYTRLRALAFGSPSAERIGDVDSDAPIVAV